MAGIKDAIVELLREDDEVGPWATGGIHARRAPALTEAEKRSQNAVRRNKYIVVRVVDSYDEETDSQGGPATVTTDTIECRVFANSSAGANGADEGGNRVRRALDAIMNRTAADILIQRIRWDGTTDQEFEDASGAEQLIDACVVRFKVGYDLPT